MISVIIPTMNSASHLAQTLGALVDAAADGLVKEVIVVDGGSTDETIAIADAAGCRLESVALNRARQMLAGAAQARAKWLLFLRPDTLLLPGWAEEAERFMRGPKARKRAGVFRFALDDDDQRARRLELWARLRSDWLKMPCGDQGMLISRAFYDVLGGHADLEALEDFDLARRVGRRRLVLLKTEAIANIDGRRNYRLTDIGRDLWLTARLLIGTDPAKLTKDA